MVSTAASKMCMTELIFASLEWKSTASITATFYSLDRCCQLAIKHIASDTFVFQQDNAPSHRAKDTIKLLQQETPDFIGADLWPPNSPDQNLVDYKVWGVMQQRVYKCRMNSVDELKQRLIDVWNSLQRNVIDAAINEWKKQLRACVLEDRQHFEHLLPARVTNKSYGQIKHK